MYGILIREGVGRGAWKNIGDYVQSIAQKQFLKDKETCFVEIEKLSEFKSEEPVNVINLIAELSPKKITKVTFSEEVNNMPYLPFKLAVMDTTKVRELRWKLQTNLCDMFKWTIESF